MFIPAIQKIIIMKILLFRTFEALRGTCFLPENGQVPYVYDRNKNDRFRDIQKVLIRLNHNQRTRVNGNDFDETETLAGLIGWDIEFVMN